MTARPEHHDIELVAWVGDGLVPADRAVVSVYDRGFRSGEGVFETFRTYGSHVFRLDQHVDRAMDGAEALGFRFPPREQVVRALRTTAAANHERLEADAALRLVATPGPIDPASAFPGAPVDEPTLVVTSHPLAIDQRIYRDGVTAISVPWARELPHVKALSYLSAGLARRTARQRGVDEALLTDAAGVVLEASSANLFVVAGARLVTPPLEVGLLPGVTRAAVLEIAESHGLDVEQHPFTLEELLAADEAFLTASTREVVPLVRVNGQPVGSGRPGDLTATIHGWYRDAAAREAAGSR